jgi:hypothetical protein
MKHDGQVETTSRGYVAQQHKQRKQHKQESDTDKPPESARKQDKQVAGENDAETAGNGAPVYGVYAVYDNTHHPLSADEGNERVQQLKDEGMREDFAVAEVMKQMKGDG